MITKEIKSVGKCLVPFIVCQVISISFQYGYLAGDLNTTIEKIRQGNTTGVLYHMKEFVKLDGIALPAFLFLISVLTSLWLIKKLSTHPIKSINIYAYMTISVAFIIIQFFSYSIFYDTQNIMMFFPAIITLSILTILCYSWCFRKIINY